MRPTLEYCHAEVLRSIWLSSTPRSEVLRRAGFGPRKSGSSEYLRTRRWGSDACEYFSMTQETMDDLQSDKPLLTPSDTFVHRHIGPDAADVRQMLDLLGYESLEDLIDATIPAYIRLKRSLEIGE